MNVTFAHSPLHTPEQVREILAEAAAIADEFEPLTGVGYPIFEEACRLLGARASTALMEQPAPLDLTTLRRNSRNG